VLRAFYNVCRHRGATLVEEPCGQLVRFQCPYHAWIYDLQGNLRPPRHMDQVENFDPAEWGLVPARLATWQGYVFVDLSGEAPELLDHLGDLPGQLDRYDLGGLRRSRRIDYDVAANWKALIENYEECYHCPGVHPQLNKITPYDLGAYLTGEGPWMGSWMEVVGDFETLSTDGRMHGRPPIAGTREIDHKRVYYFVVWPNLLLSIHPDYLMTHWVWPVEPGRTTVVCEWAFDPRTMARPDFDPSDAVEFWDLTNRQDWHVCELQQVGTRSRAYTPGRYSGIESSVHGFDLMVADRYAGDGLITGVGRIAKQSSGRARRSERTTHAAD
jgi:Rieske 2Fe-2S family protein